MRTMSDERVNLQAKIAPEIRQSIDRIADEWRMNLTETIGALVKHWERSNDTKRIEAIRRPVRRQPQPATA
jgi:uncharacterized membrane-anchored protein YjiN (DUF445 family)